MLAEALTCEQRARRVFVMESSRGRAALVGLAALNLPLAAALNNGVGLLPSMGFNTWCVRGERRSSSRESSPQ